MHIPWLGCGPPEGQAICNLHFANLCCMPQRGCPWPAASMNHIRVQPSCAYLLSLAIATLVFQFGPANGLLCVSRHDTATNGDKCCHVAAPATYRLHLPQLTAHVVRKRIIGDQLPLINGTLNVQRSMRCAVSSHLGDSADSNDLSIATAKATDRRH